MGNSAIEFLIETLRGTVIGEIESQDLMIKWPEQHIEKKMNVRTVTFVHGASEQKIEELVTRLQRENPKCE